MIYSLLVICFLLIKCCVAGVPSDAELACRADRIRFCSLEGSGQGSGSGSGSGCLRNVEPDQLSPLCRELLERPSPCAAEHSRYCTVWRPHSHQSFVCLIKHSAHLHDNITDECQKFIEKSLSGLPQERCSSVVCAPEGPCVHAETCFPATGQCLPARHKRDGTLCDDHNEHTINDICIHGECHGKLRSISPIKELCLQNYLTWNGTQDDGPQTVPTEFLDRFHTLTATGLANIRARGLKAIIGGVGRGMNVPSVLDNFKRLGSYFKDFHIVVVANDEPAAVDHFAQYCIRDKVTCVHRVFNVGQRAVDFGPFAAGRFSLLARCRNVVLDEAARIISTNWNDDRENTVLILADTDMRFEPDTIPASFAQMDWDLMCGNGIHQNGRYYDALALRQSDHPADLDGWQRKGAMWGVWNSMRVVGLDPYEYPVLSCFGGLAIYKAGRLLDTGCRYDETGYDCEHVTLHYCMREHKLTEMFINPTMLAYYPDATGTRVCKKYK